MIFEDILADVIKGKFLDNLTGEKIQYLRESRNNNLPSITRDEVQELIYTLDIFYTDPYIDKEKELAEIHRRLKMLGIDLFRSVKMPFSSTDKFITPLHIAITRQIDPETDLSALKKIISQMRISNQQDLFNIAIESVFLDQSVDHRMLSITPHNSLRRCSVMDLAIARDNWPAVELFLNEGFNADQIIREVPDLVTPTTSIVVEGMPRLHFAYQFGTTEMFAKLVAHPKINVNFRCEYFTAQITDHAINGYEGYAESILLDALKFSNIMLDIDKVTILLVSPNIDLSLQTKASRANFSISGRTALDIVLRKQPPQNEQLVKLVKTAVERKIEERVNSIQETLKLVQWGSPHDAYTVEDGTQTISAPKGLERHDFPSEINKLIALFAVNCEDLTTTPSGQEYLKAIPLMFKFKDAKQDDPTWETRNQSLEELKKEKAEQTRTEPKEEKYPKPFKE